MTVFLDTHAAVFLHTGDAELFAPAGRHMLNTADDVRVSPIAVLEMAYLYERGKIAYPGEQIAAFLVTQYAVTIDEAGMGAATISSASFTWTRDPFDRIITAHAAHYGAFLLTRNATIRDNYAAAIW